MLEMLERTIVVRSSLNPAQSFAFGTTLMAQSTKQELRPNPFIALRRPDTGQWIVIQPITQGGGQGSEPCSQPSVNQDSAS